MGGTKEAQVKEHLKKQQAENTKDVHSMDTDIDWAQQKDLHQQAQFLRNEYGRLRLLIETDKSPGGERSLARGVLILTCNVLMQGAETIENHYADKLGEK